MLTAKKAERKLLALFTEISIINCYNLFFNLTQETQYLHILRKINRNIVSCDDDRAFIFQYRSVRDCCGRCNLFMYNCKILC